MQLVTWLTHQRHETFGVFWNPREQGGMASSLRSPDAHTTKLKNSIALDATNPTWGSQDWGQQQADEVFLCTNMHARVCLRVHERDGEGERTQCGHARGWVAVAA